MQETPWDDEERGGEEQVNGDSERMSEEEQKQPGRQQRGCPDQTKAVAPPPARGSATRGRAERRRAHRLR